MIGGALLLNSFRGMFGGGGQQQGMLDQAVRQNHPGVAAMPPTAISRARPASNEIGRGGGGRDGRHEQ